MAMTATATFRTTPELKKQNGLSCKRNPQANKFLL